MHNIVPACQDKINLTGFFVSPQPVVSVRFYPPPEDLRRYFTSFYVTDLDPGGPETLTDCLHPEWAGLRFFSPRGPDAWIGGSAVIANAQFFASGPTSLPIHFNMPLTRMWGVGLLPLGWAHFIRKPAAEHANLICDGRQHPTFAPFASLADNLFKAVPDEAAELTRITAWFRSLNLRPVTDESRILAIHEALVDPQLVTVAELVERVAASQRTIERLCKRHFGYSPKLLLRRQRFMRSVAQFIIDPSLKWIGAMDCHYHDQAQFVRDFREFMGMTPSEYASLPHPVIDRFIQERVRVAGAAVQTLDSPNGAGVKAA